MEQREFLVLYSWCGLQRIYEIETLRNDMYDVAANDHSFIRSK